MRKLGLKPVELQVALPRTKDAGMLQSQLAQKPVQDQEQLAQDAMRRLELEQKRSEKTSSDQTVQNRNDRYGSGGRGSHKQRDGRHQPSEEKASALPHPYKGRYVDLTL